MSDTILMNQEDIKKIIPHRDPFILVDEVLEMTDESIVALKHVRGDEYFFAGHFPGLPVMPGVLIVEAMAQAGAIVALSKDENKGKIAYFAGIDKVRFKKSVFPGDTLRLEVKLTRQRGPIGFGEGKAFVDGKLCVAGEIMFAIGAEAPPAPKSEVG
jgi:3-hydroxyacyl-[acyl-carrier-protein] dehydratase